MTITEIVDEIHNQRVELEIFESLSQWMVDNIRNLAGKNKDYYNTIEAIRKIAILNYDKDNNRNETLEFIKNVCETCK